MLRVAPVSILGLVTAFALGASIGRSADPSREPLAAASGRFSQFPGPRPEHKYLQQFVGDWDYVAQATLPNGESREMKGKYRSRMACNGTWLLGEVLGNFMGFPYEGIALMGFDAQNKKYVGTWLDMAKGYLDPMVGEVTEEGHLVWVGPIPNPTLPLTRIQARGTFIPEGEDSFVYMEELDDGKGGWTPWLHMSYTRAKDGVPGHEGGDGQGQERDG